MSGPVTTLAQAKRAFRRENPNLRVHGWDERDYRLWSDIQGLRSYGLIAGYKPDHMISCNEVISLLERAAEKRFEAEWKSRYGTTK